MQIFLSYSRVDKPFIEKFAQRLKRIFRDYTIWYDDDLLGGDRWWDEILVQIGTSDIFIYLLSNESVNSLYCQAEFEEARRLQKRIITVQVRDRTRLSDELGDIQYVDMKAGMEDAEAQANLIAAINKQVKLVPRRRPKPLRKQITQRPKTAQEEPRSNPQDVETATLHDRHPAVLPKPGSYAGQIAIGIIVTVIGGILLALALKIIPPVPPVTSTPPTPPTPTPVTQVAEPLSPTPTLAVTPSPIPPTPANTETQTSSVTLTNTPTYTPSPTSTPIYTPTPVISNTLTALEDAIDRAYNFNGTKNSDWTRFEYAFEDGVPMVLVPVGCFMMGSQDGSDDEKPVHEQCFDAPFWIDKYEVRNSQFNQLNGIAGRESNWTEDGTPRENITWTEAHDFCAKRSGRLPTEREWEYASRGIESQNYPWGNDFVADYVVYGVNSRHRTFPVGTQLAGIAWVGALDMSGNVWEWVSSAYVAYPYSINSENAVTPYRVFRGGSWDFNSLYARSAKRRSNSPDTNSSDLGFRCARDVDGAH